MSLGQVAVTAQGERVAREHVSDFWDAIEKRSIDMMEGLIRKGASVNSAGKDGVTPLMIAADHGFIDGVSLLLSHRADPSLRNNDGDTALDLANISMIRNVRLIDSTSAEKRSSEEGYSKVIEALMKAISLSSAIAPHAVNKQFALDVRQCERDAGLLFAEADRVSSNMGALVSRQPVVCTQDSVSTAGSAREYLTPQQEYPSDLLPSMEEYRLMSFAASSSASVQSTLTRSGSSASVDSDVSDLSTASANPAHNKVRRVNRDLLCLASAKTALSFYGRRSSLEHFFQDLTPG